MAITSYKIDKYKVELYANDLRGNLTRWAARVVYVYSKDKHVASAYFAREGYTAPDAALGSDGHIYFHAHGEQYAPVLDLLRNEKPVYIAWQPHSDSGEPNDGNAYFYIEPEPVGEGE